MSLDPKNERISDQLVELLVATARISDRLDNVAGDVSSVMAELGGVPDPSGRGSRQTLRWRVHNLENEQAAARLIQQTHDELRKRESQVWSQRQKILLFIFAAGAFFNGFIIPVIKWVVHLIRNAGIQ